MDDAIVTLIEEVIIGWLNNGMVGWLGDEAMNGWLDMIIAARLNNEIVGLLDIG
jgi:hypothetical protein